MQQIDTNNDGYVDDEEFQNYLAAQQDSDMPPSSDTVRISGMLLYGPDGFPGRAYSGINGVYHCAGERLNFRPKYMKLGGNAALWWTNISGQIAWAVSPTEEPFATMPEDDNLRDKRAAADTPVPSAQIWAFVPSSHSSPEHSTEPWSVFSYASRSYELQHEVHIKCIVDLESRLTALQCAFRCHRAR